MSIGDRYKTGENSPANANYDWDGYTDGTNYPSPTNEERKISLDKNEVFPPIKSCSKGAFWKMTSYR
jgi:hypothetical protein